jgi:hypothetical protein
MTTRSINAFVGSLFEIRVYLFQSAFAINLFLSLLFLQQKWRAIAAFNRHPVERPTEVPMITLR